MSDKRQPTFAGRLTNRRAADERSRLFEGLARFVNTGDSSEDYSQLAITAKSFWPINANAPTGENGLDRPIEWGPAGYSLYKAFRDYLRRVWVGDYGPNNNTWREGLYLNYLLGLDRAFAMYEPGNYDDALLPDRAFAQGWAELWGKYPGVYNSSRAEVKPEWGKSRFEYVAVNDFQKAVYALFLESWRAKICRRCKRYFIADKNAQAFCSTACSGGNRRDRGLRYWRETGARRRAAKKHGSRPQRKERSNDLPQGETRNLLVAVPLCWPLRSRVDQNHKQDAGPRGRASAQARTCGEVQWRPKTHVASYDLSGIEILDREACRSGRRYPRNIRGGACTR